MQHLYLFVVLSISWLAFSQDCYPSQYFKFIRKTNLAPEPIIPNPYKNPSEEYLAKVNENLKNKDRVCALQYQDRDRKTYKLQNFDTRS